MLVGGSGLSLRLNHRSSEDLDFAFFGDRLPRQRLDGLMAASAKGAFRFERNDDAAALNEFSLGGIELQDYRNAFLEAKDEPNCDIGLTRLCSGIPQRDDEGYAHLMKNAPSLDEMKASFVKMRDEIEIGRAAEAARRRAGGEKSSAPSVEKS